MIHMKDYVLSVLKDHKGDPSSSRWIALLSFAALVGLIWIGVGSDPKQHKLIIDLGNILCWLIIGCVAAGQGASATSAMVGARPPTPTPPPSPTTPPLITPPTTPGAPPS